MKKAIFLHTKLNLAKTAMVLLSIVFISAAGVAFSQTNETTSITTYFPSPNGAFKVLHLDPQASAPTCQAGAMYYSSADHQLKVCASAGGALTWTNVVMPSGTILMFNCSNPLPSGWQWFTGAVDRYFVTTTGPGGAGGSFPAGTGGAANHQHAINTYATQNHSHSISPQQTTADATSQEFAQASGAVIKEFFEGCLFCLACGKEQVADNGHTHTTGTVSTSSAGGYTLAFGNSGNIQNLPPYYSECFIQKQ